MKTIQAWTNEQGGFVGQLDAGEPVEQEPAEILDTWRFTHPDVDWCYSHRGQVFAPGAIRIPDNIGRPVYTRFGTEEECRKFVIARIPLAPYAADLSTEEQIARQEALVWRGALRPSAVRRLRQLDLRLFGGGITRNTPIAVTLAPRDLRPGYTYALFFDLYYWRTYRGILKSKGWAETEPHRVVGTVAAYWRLRAPGVPESLRRKARRWADGEELPPDEVLWAQYPPARSPDSPA